MFELVLSLFIAPILMSLFVACTSEKSPEVYTAVNDGEGGVWAGTKNGMYYRAAKSNTFRQIPLPSISHHPFPAVYALCSDSVRNRLWIGAWNHLYCYDIARQRFVIIRDSVICQTVRLTCDSSGIVRALTGHGQYSFTLDNDSLHGESTKRLDSMAYPKPEYTNIDAKGWHFETKQTGYNMSAVSILIIAVIILVLAAFLYVMKLHTARHLPDKQTVPTDKTDTAELHVEHAPQKVDFIDRARRVVQKHMGDEDFSAEVFAQDMAVSRAQLFRKLKAANGQTPKEFIDEQRMAHAATLLTTTDRTMLDIAVCVGYSDASNFRRTFMRLYGVTPSEWRKKKSKVGEG